MKIAIVGSREFFKSYNKEKGMYLFDIEKQNFFTHIIVNEFTTKDILISGGARGVDSFAEKVIENQFRPAHIQKKIFLPDWDKYGKRAGFLRNQLIIDEADRVIAFWDGTSKGTKHSIDLAIKAGKPIDIYVR